MASTVRKLMRPFPISCCMRLCVIAILGAALVCTASTTAAAQWATPSAVTSWAQVSGDVQLRHAQRRDVSRPRTRVVLPLALMVGIGGAVVGYYAAEESCARTNYECWDHFAYMPAGYVLGVAIGAGGGGLAEGCRTGLLRSAGGALLGLLGGAGVAMVSGRISPGAAPLALLAGPVVGATWLVTSCRTAARAVSAPVDG